MIKSFTRGNINTVRSEIDAKLAELKALGLDIKVGNIRYSDGKADIKVTATILGGDDEYAVEWSRNMQSRVNPNAVGKRVVFQGEKFTFRGFKPRARTRKAIIEADNGNLYRIELNSIIDQL